MRDAEFADAIYDLQYEVRKRAQGRMFNPEGFYGLSHNDHPRRAAGEFIAEALTDQWLQRELQTMPITPYMRSRLGLNRHNSTTKSMWDWLIAAVHKAVGWPPNTITALDAALRITDDMMTGHAFRGLEMPEKTQEAWVRRLISDTDKQLERNIASFTENILGRGSADANADAYPITSNTARPERRLAGRDAGLALSPVKRVTHAVTQAVEDITKRTQLPKPKLLSLASFDYIARASDPYFGGAEKNPVRRIQRLNEQIRTRAGELLKGSEPIVKRFYELERKYGPQKWAAFASLLNDETAAGVFVHLPLDHEANVKIIGKDTLHGPYMKRMYGKLRERWAVLPDDLKAARQEALDYYRQMQNAEAFNLVKNSVLKVLGVEDDALAKRIYDGKATDADIEHIGKEAYDFARKQMDLAKIKGPYYPLMRRGDWVVMGRVKFDTPPGVKRIEDNIYEFTDRKAALAWAEKLADEDGPRPTVESVWVDKKTGERHFTEADGSQVKVLKQDTDAEQRFRVTVEDRLVEFLDSERKARRMYEELRRDKNFHSVDVQQKRMVEHFDRDLAASQVKVLHDSLVKRPGYHKLSAQERNEVIQALNTASLRLLGATRIQSHRLPRQNVLGASKDATRNMLEYAQSASRYVAKLELQPQLDAAMKEMHDHAKGDYAAEGSLGRSVFVNEVEQRIRGNNGYQDGGMFAPAINRLLTVSFIDKLFSPAHSVINSLQPSMVTAPVLAAKHGMGRTFQAIGRAYADIGALSNIKAGLGASARKAINIRAEGVNFLEDAKARLKGEDAGEIKTLWDNLAKVGSIDPDAGLEVASLIKRNGRFVGALDSGIGYLEGIARQMPRAVEANNRLVTAMAAYRLERSRGASIEAATRYAEDMVNSTQFLYSAANMPVGFNKHPLAKLALQFKKIRAWDVSAPRLADRQGDPQS